MDSPLWGLEQVGWAAPASQGIVTLEPAGARTGSGEKDKSAESTQSRRVARAVVLLIQSRRRTLGLEIRMKGSAAAATVGPALPTFLRKRDSKGTRGGQGSICLPALGGKGATLPPSSRSPCPRQSGSGYKDPRHRGGCGRV